MVDSYQAFVNSDQLIHLIYVTKQASLFGWKIKIIIRNIPMRLKIAGGNLNNIMLKYLVSNHTHVPIHGELQYIKDGIIIVTTCFTPLKILSYPTYDAMKCKCIM